MSDTTNTPRERLADADEREQAYQSLRREICTVAEAVGIDTKGMHQVEYEALKAIRERLELTDKRRDEYRLAAEALEKLLDDLVQREEDT